jgi:Flp pilus assembly protein TadD
MANHDTVAVHPSARGPRRVALCTLLALLAWSGSVVRGGFSFDDREAIESNPVVEGSVAWTETFSRDYWHHRQDAGHLRPTASLSLRADRALHGDAAWGHHATNVLLHAACVALAGIALLLARDPKQPRPLHWIGLALFAVHPALADSVAWISGRTSMLSALPALASAVAILWAVVPWRPASAFRLAWTAGFAALGIFLALCGKEDSVVFALAFAGLGALHSRRLALAAALGSAAGTAAYLALRAHVYGSPWPSASAAPLAGATLAERLACGGRALVEALRLALTPIGYPPSYESSRALDAARAGAALGWLGALGWSAWLAAFAASAVALIRRPRSIVAACALLALLASLAWTQIVPAGALFAPRFLYLPLLFAIPLVDTGFVRVFGRASALAAGVAIALGVVGAWQRAGVYASRASFHAEVLRHEPGDARAWNDYGLAIEESGDVERARRAYERAADLDPSYGRPWSNLGRLALGRGDVEAAELALRKAVALGARNPVARANLALVLARRGCHGEAIDHFHAATELAPGLATAWRGLARSLITLERLDEAKAALRRALALDPEDDVARAMLERLETAR